MNTTAAPVAASEQDGAREQGYSTVADAVAEMDRREQARAERRRAEKARAAAAADPKADDDDAGDDGEADHDPRRRADKPKAGADDKPAKAKQAKADDDDDDAGADEGDEDGDEDGADDQDADSNDERPGDDDDDAPEPKRAQAEQATPAKVRLSIDGRDVEATPDEITTYLREATTERQQLAQARQQITQQAQAMQQQGQALAQLAQAMLGAEPALEMAQTDPGTYIAHQAQYRQRLELLQQLQGHTSQAAQIAQAQHQQAFAQTVERERAALLKAIPELADPAKLAAFTGRVVKVAQRYGLTAQDLSGAYDHRSYLMLRDLGRLHDMEAERAATRAKLKGAPPLKSPEQRAGQGQRNTDDLRSKDAKRAFLKSPRTMRDVKAYLARTER